MSDILILAYYWFTPIADPQTEVTIHQAFLSNKDVMARIYISEQGINGQMSASREAATAYMDWMNSRQPFAEMPFKLHDHHEHVFPRLTVKYRKELVAVGTEVDLSRRGQHVSPEEWKAMLEKEQDRLLIDVRNNYEWQVGRFEGADTPPLEEFRHFPAYAEKLKERADPKTTPVMMYCTGGIRCEIFSAIMMQAGFEQVYQLDGGVINYGNKVGNDHWLGKLFVFDDRLTVPLEGGESPVVGKCHYCDSPTEDYYNCANMDCNRLALFCKECLEKSCGCCQLSCQEAPRRRPYGQQHPHKPFRKWYHYAKEKKDLYREEREETRRDTFRDCL